MIHKERENSNDRTAHDSHTNFRYLSKDEMVQRANCIQKEKRKAAAMQRRLESKVQELIDKEGIVLFDKDDNDVATLFENVSPQVTAEFSEDGFQRLLWKQQKQYNSLRDKRQMRWHPTIVRFALSLHYASTSAYHFVTKSGFLSLPSERTLRDYTHWCSVNNGVHFHFIQQMKKELDRQGVVGKKRLFCLLMDEMKVRSGLVFSKSTGELVGFSDLGTVNSDLEKLRSVLTSNQPMKTKGEIADHMLAFMVRPAFKPSLSFTVASYPCSDLTGHKLYPTVWEVVESLELNGLPVVSVTSDGASQNRHFYKLCRSADLDLPYKTTNPFDRERFIYFFCDPPHLIKTARNCFSNSYAHSLSQQMQVIPYTGTIWRWF